MLTVQYLIIAAVFQNACKNMAAAAGPGNVSHGSFMTDDFKELFKARDGSMSSGDLSLDLIRLSHANTDSETHTGDWAEGKSLLSSSSPQDSRSKNLFREQLE